MMTIILPSNINIGFLKIVAFVNRSFVGKEDT